MNRITEKDGEFYKLKPENEFYGWENGIRLVQIIGWYEDLAEELGCPLEVVDKALKEGIHAKDQLDENKLNYIPAVALSNVGTEWYLSNHCGFCVNVRDYKEIFWLREDKSE